MKDSVATPIRAMRAVAAPALPVDKLLVGKPVEEAAALLPRVFSLCRAAQEVAEARALGLEDSGADITGEITRDHLLKLFVSWPKFFGQQGRVTADMLHDPDAAVVAMFGPAGLPQSAETMEDFLQSGYGITPLLQRTAGCFGPGEAVADDLPLAAWTPPMDKGAAENSPAGRRREFPGLEGVEAKHGRGPLWRALGRAVDLALILRGDTSEAITSEDGVALVPATRGRYAVQATVENGHVTAFKRITPTDHMTAPDGILDLTLGSLPADKTNLAPLVLDILDPCSTVRLEEVEDA